MICGLTIYLTFCSPAPRKEVKNTFLLPSLLFQVWESDTTLGRINHPLPLLEPAHCLSSLLLDCVCIICTRHYVHTTAQNHVIMTVHVTGVL